MNYLKKSLLFFVCFFSFHLFSQVKSLEETVFDFTPVYNASELVYYGADFSKFGFGYANKVGQEQEMVKFIPAWMADLNGIYTLNVLPRLLKKEIVGNLQSVQNNFKDIGAEWIYFESTHFGIEEVKEQVKTYQLEEKSGVALVLLVEQFNKEQEKGTVYFTLFDIETRVVLYVNKMQGEAVGVGMTNHWASVLTSSFDVFITDYREQLHRAKKAKKKAEKS